MTRPHGTLSKYMGDRCRCSPCRDAKVSYERTKRRLVAYGRWQPYVDAEAARSHVLDLMEYGIDWQRIAKVAGVSTTVVRSLLYGTPRKGWGPAQRIRPESERKLLAVTKTPENVADWVDACGSRRRLQALATRGWTIKYLAGRCGLKETTAGVISTGRNRRVTPATARKITALYDELWDQGPPETTSEERRAATLVRRLAARKGWVPPLAWDDDTIDDPAATPNVGEKPSRVRALLEDSEELVTRDGYTWEQAAERLGVSPGYLRGLHSEVRRKLAEATT